MLLALESFYISTMGFFKISLGLFLLRVIIDKRQRQFIYWILFIFSLYSLGYFFLTVFQCGVPHGATFWQGKLGNQCLTITEGYGLSYTHAALTAMTDIIFVVIPIPLVMRSSSLQLREKWVVGFILGIGTV